MSPEGLNVKKEKVKQHTPMTSAIIYRKFQQNESFT